MCAVRFMRFRSDVVLEVTSDAILSLTDPDAQDLPSRLRIRACENATLRKRHGEAMILPFAEGHVRAPRNPAMPAQNASGTLSVL
jgi:hypothetical protein